MEIKKYLIKMANQKNKDRIIIFVCFFLCLSVFSQEKADSLLVEYFHKTIHSVNRDSADTLNLRGTIFDLINLKLVAGTCEDVFNLIGSPMHIYRYKNGEKALIYPISPLFRKNKGGSDLYLFFIDADENIIRNTGHVHFIETEEDLYYWISPALPLESKEGDKNCPPTFK